MSHTKTFSVRSPVEPTKTRRDLQVNNDTCATKTVTPRAPWLKTWSYLPHTFTETDYGSEVNETHTVCPWDPNPGFMCLPQTFYGWNPYEDDDEDDDDDDEGLS